MSFPMETEQNFEIEQVKSYGSNKWTGDWLTMEVPDTSKPFLIGIRLSKKGLSAKVKNFQNL